MTRTPYRTVIEMCKEALRSIAPFEWLDEVHAAIEPPQGFVTHNGKYDETTAYLMMIIEGLNVEAEDPEHDELKAVFLACCERLWDDNSVEAEGLPSTYHQS